MEVMLNHLAQGYNLQRSESVRIDRHQWGNSTSLVWYRISLSVRVYGEKGCTKEGCCTIVYISISPNHEDFIYYLTKKRLTKSTTA